MKNITLLMLLWIGVSAQAYAQTISFQKLSENVYAYIGPLTDRTKENYGLNNNIGLILTEKGAVLIDSGAGGPSAKVLEKAVKSVTKQPIIGVINTGSQDHRWLGNHYFHGKGAQIYALATTIQTQQKMKEQIQDRMIRVDRIYGKTEPLSATKPAGQNSAKFKIGGVLFELHHFGDAHFPGDAVLWLPEQKILFSGDLIYVDRLLGVHPFSKVATWNQAYQQARKFPAAQIVPGHGQVCDWQKADAETGSYLQKLMETSTEAAEEMLGVDEYVQNNQNWQNYLSLRNYEHWHKRNLNRSFLQAEAGL